MGLRTHDEHHLLPAATKSSPRASTEEHGAPVLILADNPDVRQTLVTAFESMGFATLQPANTAQALALLRRGKRPCLILLDLVPPALDGRAFRRAQQADPRLAPIPVIVLSAFADLPRVRRLGAHVLVKPVDLEVLKAAVKEVCT